jgi:hypothetical protein
MNTNFSVCYNHFTTDEKKGDIKDALHMIFCFINNSICPFSKLINLCVFFHGVWWSKLLGGKEGITRGQWQGCSVRECVQQTQPTKESKCAALPETSKNFDREFPYEIAGSEMWDTKRMSPVAREANNW